MWKKKVWVIYLSIVIITSKYWRIYISEAIKCSVRANCKGYHLRKETFVPCMHIYLPFYSNTKKIFPLEISNWRSSMLSNTWVEALFIQWSRNMMWCCKNKVIIMLWLEKLSAAVFIYFQPFRNLCVLLLSICSLYYSNKIKIEMYPFPLFHRTSAAND